MDAEARAFTKSIIKHNGKKGCEKCTVEGRKVAGRMTFTNLDAPLRTDDSFLNRDDPAHHKNIISPLEEIGTNMVSQFPLEPLHLVYLGVFKRWLDFILKERGPFSIEDEALDSLSSDLCAIKPSTPSEFKRKPKKLKRRGNHLKGKELRRILLYDGPKIFKENLEPNLYKNFLLLHVPIYILASPHLYETLNDVADALLREFVAHAKDVFGTIFVVYNPHSFIHLAAECRRRGPLDSWSTFKYENYLGVMRRTLRSGARPLQQLANRCEETGGLLTNPKTPEDPDTPVLSMSHHIDEDLEEGSFDK